MNTSKYTHGFSLIELMVVVAIAAILAVVAVPAYRKYIITTRMAEDAVVFQKVVDQAMVYAGQRGFFPNARQLGLNDGVAHTQVVSVTNDLMKYNLGNMAIEGQDSCGRFGSAWMSLDPVALGFSPSVANEVMLGADFWHAGGVVYKVFYYIYCSSTSNTCGVAPMLPSPWFTMNSTTAYPSNHANLYARSANYNAAFNHTCM